MDRHGGTTVQVVPGLKASAVKVQTTTAARLVQRMLDGYGQAELFEWTHAADIGKVAFDIDARATDTTAPALLAAALAALVTFFGFMPDLVVLASSHGPPTGPNAHKLSFRIYVSGFRMRLADVKARILRLGLDSRHGGPFDPAIYSTNQKLRLVGSVKGSGDTRNLQLIDSAGAPVQPTPDLLLATLVQVVDDSWPLLAEPPTASIRDPREGRERRNPR